MTKTKIDIWEEELEKANLPKESLEKGLAKLKFQERQLKYQIQSTKERIEDLYFLIIQKQYSEKSRQLSKELRLELSKHMLSLQDEMKVILQKKQITKSLINLSK